MNVRVLPLLPMLLLSGCALLERQSVPEASRVEAPLTASEAMTTANDLATRGRWSAAQEVLDVALRQFPGDRRLGEERASMVARRQRAERLLEDRIMVGDAENQHTKIQLLEQLSLARPDDLVVLSRRIYWKEVLASKIEQLTACGEFHAADTTALARRCIDLASAIPTTAVIDQRLARVSAQLRASDDIAAERRRAREEKERHQRAKALLVQAKAAIDASDYRRALDILEKVAQLQPDNREVSGLQQKALAIISPQVDALVKLGDHLYLEEQLDAAVATWQAALTLRPDDEEILTRIERARTVLERLDQLRQQQKAVPAEPPAASGDR